MEYKLCKDNGNILRCDFECRKYANLVYDAMTNENENLKMQIFKLSKEKDGFINEIKRITNERNKIHDELKELKKENDYLDQECESLLAKFSERIAELEKENAKLRDDNQRFAHECRYYIERESNLANENDKLRTMNSDLLYRNGLLMKTTGPGIFRPSYSYNELNNKIESLKEDIIRLDKCLSNRQCVQLERIKEEDHA